MEDIARSFINEPSSPTSFTKIRIHQDHSSRVQKNLEISACHSARFPPSDKSSNERRIWASDVSIAASDDLTIHVFVHFNKNRRNGIAGAARKAGTNNVFPNAGAAHWEPRFLETERRMHRCISRRVNALGGKRKKSFIGTSLSLFAPARSILRLAAGKTLCEWFATLLVGRITRTSAGIEWFNIHAEHNHCERIFVAEMMVNKCDNASESEVNKNSWGTGGNILHGEEEMDMEQGKIERERLNMHFEFLLRSGLWILHWEANFEFLIEKLPLDS